MSSVDNWTRLQKARAAVAESNTWTTRKELSESHELVVCDLLRKLGIACWLIGQALVPRDARDLLRKTKLKLRWWPDILAIRLPDVWLIDAKADARHGSPNYSVEKDAHQAHYTWGTLVGGQQLYVWDDFRVSRVNELQLKRSGPFQGNGSGTPFWLVGKDGADGPVYDFREFFAEKEAATT